MDRVEIDADIEHGGHGSDSYFAILMTIERGAEAFDLVAQYQRSVGGAWDTLALFTATIWSYYGECNRLSNW